METGCRWDSYTTDIDELASAQGEACTLGRQDLLGTKLWKDFDADAAGFPPWAELMPDDDVVVDDAQEKRRSSKISLLRWKGG